MTTGKRRGLLSDSLFNHYRGMGDSKARKDDPFTIETLARDLLSLIQHLQWSEVALCGHSMGGRF